MLLLQKEVPANENSNKIVDLVEKIFDFKRYQKF